MLNPKMLVLLSQYGGKRFEDLSPQDIKSVAASFNFDLSLERAQEIRDELGGDSDDTISGWLGKPGNLDLIKSKFTPKPELVDSVACKCPHCGNLFELEIT